MKLFVNRGERSGIDEEDLRWALREGAVLPDEKIHDVRVLHRFSFVEVDPDEAERTVEFLDGTKLKGKEIRLEVAPSQLAGASGRPAPSRCRIRRFELRQASTRVTANRRPGITGTPLVWSGLARGLVLAIA